MIKCIIQYNCVMVNENDEYEEPVVFDEYDSALKFFNKTPSCSEIEKVTIVGREQKYETIILKSNLPITTLDDMLVDVKKIYKLATINKRDQFIYSPNIPQYD